MKTTDKKPYIKKSATTKYSAKANAQSAIMGGGFGRLYLIGSLLILLGTTLFWTILGAHLQANNADQLADPYLFSNYHTFHAAAFPAAHTFLLKWPIFALIAATGISANHILLATIACVLTTIGALVYVLYRIERRPLVLGTIYLGLASILLLIPAQPYAGAILPVNMAMLATRNLEYVVYMGALLLLAKSPRMRSVGFWAGVMVLSILLASDKLFLGLSAGGAMVALIGYALSRSWAMVSLAVRWLLGTGIALVGAGIIIWVISSVLGITHISGGSDSSPYALVGGAKSGLEGAIFAFLGFFTNFGANPAHDATRFKDIPRLLQHGLISVGGPAYVVNAALLIVGLWVSLRRIVSTLYRNYRGHNTATDLATKLSSMFICSAIAAIVIFVLSKHQYSVDARYLGIVLFAFFILLATTVRQMKWPDVQLYRAGMVLCASILLGIIAIAGQQHTKVAALSDVNQRDQRIARAMRGRHTNVLIGDYWRVLPTKLASDNALSVWPLSACTQPRTVLTSQAWRPQMTDHSFAYLLSLDKSQTDYPQCSLEEVLAAYGKPNASFPVAGNLSHPKELLLFYDHGVHKTSPLSAQASHGPATVLPIPLSELPNTSCDVPTVVNIVAHQDDDLLFLSPDLQHDIKDGHCVRTIYLTAGDSGRDSFYWLGRQQGSEAAYATITGAPDIWIQRIVKVAENQYITVANMRGNAKVSLIFMNLPDGNLKGEGFGASKGESLDKLLYGRINTIHAVDGQSSFSSNQLVSALADVMHIYQPAEIKTQSDVAGTTFRDHSDHLAASQFARKAHDAYQKQQFDGLVQIPLVRYIGYPVHERPANISGQDLQDKERAFFAYAQFDGAACHSMGDCARVPTYSTYLERQYQEATH